MMASGEASRVPTPTPRRRVLLVAGEASGDQHGADFLRALRRRMPDIEVFGLGGEHCRAEGMQTLADAGEVATVGLLEGAARLRTVVRIYRELRRRLRENPPDLCVLIDFPEFNLRLAGAAKRAGVPVLYYIAPQVWAWRRGRVRKIARRVDRLAVVFPFEAGLYESSLPGVEFVGHPLLDRVEVTAGRVPTLRAHGLDPSKRTVLLLPGSRAKEIDYILPRLLEAAEELSKHGNYQFPLVLAHTLSRTEVEARVRAARTSVSVPIIDGDMHNLIAAADIALVASGTATLECALLECPMVIVYRLSPVTFALARLLVRGVQNVGMPNIVAGHEVVPELLQGQVRGDRIAAAARGILDDPARHAAITAELRDIRRRLGRGGAADRAAAIASEMMGAGGT
ncbi:MAG TPA: lipid-A-disaccharide synthase [Candidatus Binatia bacterium]|jgi:lipid-A-disaccharide synthase|nr:lipid-A-disaccharide synthase [Candidatus Binatia bacterium]